MNEQKRGAGARGGGVPRLCKQTDRQTNWTGGGWAQLGLGERGWDLTLLQDLCSTGKKKENHGIARRYEKERIIMINKQSKAIKESMRLTNSNEREKFR